MIEGAAVQQGRGLTLTALGLSEAALGHTGREIPLPNSPDVRFRAWGSRDEARRFQAQAAAWPTLRSLIGPDAETAVTWPTDIVWSSKGAVGHISAVPIPRAPSSDTPDLGDRLYAWHAVLNSVHAVHRCGWVLGGIRQSMTIDAAGIPACISGYDRARSRQDFPNVEGYLGARAQERIELAGLLLAGLSDGPSIDALPMGLKWSPAAGLKSARVRVLEQLWRRIEVDPARPPSGREWMFALAGPRAIHAARAARHRSGQAASGSATLLYVIMGPAPVDRGVWGATWWRFATQLSGTRECRVAVHACDDDLTVLSPLGPLSPEWRIADAPTMRPGAPSATADALKDQIVNDSALLLIDEVTVESLWILVHNSVPAIAPTDQWLNHVGSFLGHRVHVALYSDMEIRLQDRFPGVPGTQTPQPVIAVPTGTGWAGGVQAPMGGPPVPSSSPMPGQPRPWPLGPPTPRALPIPPPPDPPGFRLGASPTPPAPQPGRRVMDFVRTHPFAWALVAAFVAIVILLIVVTR